MEIRMKLLLIVFFTSSAFAFDSKNALSFGIRQYTLLSERLSGDTSEFISTGNPLSTNWSKTGVSNWTVGFYGGILWTLYSLTGDNYWKELAEQFQDRVKTRQFDTSTHDVGFVIMSTYGLCLKYTGNYNLTVPIIEQTAKSLSQRFYPLARVIRSWNNDWGGGVEGEVKVIADNMMNLELLFEASKLTGNSTFSEIAISHANRTIEEHMRPDGSTFHVVAYNETTGNVVRKYNWQGLKDNSTWSRGISWVIHGLATTYELSNRTFPRFLEYSELAANFVISRLPDDKIPFWDFDALLESGYQPKDTAAASVTAHGLLKLFEITKKPTYFQNAEMILTNLNSEKYRSDGKKEYKIQSILVNGTVSYPEHDFNTAIVYGDFYFLQALKLHDDILARN